MQLKVVYVTLETLPQLVLKDHPLDESFHSRISAIQRGDYLKAYFMHLYGGGYSDVKNIQESYIPARDKLREHL